MSKCDFNKVAKQLMSSFDGIFGQHFWITEIPSRHTTSFQRL